MLPLMEVKMSEGRRPIGLTVLAVIQFILTVGVLAAFASPRSLGVYGTISPVMTGIVMVVSAIGYLRRNYYLGFICGNILGIGSIANILIFNAAQGFTNFAIYIPSMIYPVVLLALLNLRYRDAFGREATQ